MRENLTEIVFILDRSGSMHGLERDTIGGFNAMLESERNKDGEALVSTVLFDDTTAVIHDRIDIKNVPALTEKEYSVGGCTALLDAIGGAIHHIGNIHKYSRPEDIPAKTVFIITTDGMENASRYYSKEKVKAMIEKEKTKYGWEFIFLGANIDAVESAGAIGIGRDRAVNFRSDSYGTRANYRSIGRAIDSIRQQRCLSPDWAEEAERYFESGEMIDED